MDIIIDVKCDLIDGQKGFCADRQFIGIVVSTVKKISNKYT